MEFYTTADQEAALDKKFKELLAKKQAAMTERQQKYTARAHVSRPIRTFKVREGIAAFDGGGDDGQPMPDAAQVGGKTYRLDPDCKKVVEKFCEKHGNTYTVHFMPDGLYGPCVNYACYSTPAILKAGQEELWVHREEKYDVGVS
jgi:hypothetical protein